MGHRGNLIQQLHANGRVILAELGELQECLALGCGVHNLFLPCVQRGRVPSQELIVQERLATLIEKSPTTRRDFSQSGSGPAATILRTLLFLLLKSQIQNRCRCQLSPMTPC